MTVERAPASEPAIAAEAPVVSAEEVAIDAPIDRVWEVLTAIERWPEWNPDGKSVSMDDPLERGSSFRWRSGPWTITSRVSAWRHDYRMP